MVAFCLDTMGFKRSSEIITISGEFKNATGGFAVQEYDLQLNPLDQEVFVVLSVQIDFMNPMPLPLLGGAPSIPLVSYPAALSTTRPSAQLDISDSQVFGYARQDVRCALDAAGNPISYTISEQSSDVPDTNLDYIAIIATDSYFMGSTDDPAAPVSSNDVSFRIYGYRARADAATYAALVQSEVLSA